MEYHGKLYGKIGNKYFDTGKTSNDFDELEKKSIKQSINNGLPTSEVVFFELKKGKYIASNGVEVTTEFILKHEHALFHDNGYVIINR